MCLASQSQPFVSKELSVDFDDWRVLVHGEPANLIPIEYKLLCYLIRNPRRCSPMKNSEGLVKAHIQRLRKKLSDSTQNPRLIITERGRDYRFIDNN